MSSSGASEPDSDGEGPRLDVAALVARVRATEGPDRRLPLPPDVLASEIFPFDGELAVRSLADPVAEPPRQGEQRDDCPVCPRPDADYLWAGARWRLGTSPVPSGVPAFLLYPREHLDLGGLDATLASELGRLVVAAEVALDALPGVARVHVHKWGDGLAHLHVWFLLRPAGLPQLRGSCLPDWLDLLPPVPEDEVNAIGAHLAAALAAVEAATP